MAPTYPIASEIWRDLKKATQFAWTEKGEDERRIELPGGGRVAVKSADDPAKLVGAGLDGLVIDEAAKVRPETWFESLRPALSDKRGWAVFIGTPKGFNWLHDLYQNVRPPDWERWQRPTSDNPLISEAELEAAQRDSPRYYGQEYLAQFASVEGAEFEPGWFGSGIWFDEWPPCSLRVIALDPSKGKSDRVGDYSAFVLLGLDKQGTLWCDADLERRPVPRIVSDGLRLLHEFKPTAFAIETNAYQDLLGAEFIRVARSRGVVFPGYGIGNYIPKPVRIRTLAPLLAQGKIRFKRGSRGSELLVQQLRDWPVGAFDDGCDSLEMAVRMMMEMMGQSIQGAKPKAMEG